MNRATAAWLLLASVVLPGGCQRESEKAPAPRPRETVIRHNDGTGERLLPGDLVRFPGTLVLDFEHGASITNLLQPVPPPGVPIAGRDPDMVCADLDIGMADWDRLMPLSHRPATVTGRVAPRRPESACAIALVDVRVTPR